MSNYPPDLQSLAETDKEPESSPRLATSSTVAKALGIVDILADRADTGISLAELSAVLGMPKSTAYRYLSTLIELGLAERNNADRFRLGTRVIELAGTYLAKSDLRNESQPILAELAEESGETIHLAVPDGIEVVYIAKVESRHAWGMLSLIGTRLPMYCTALGKSILAFSSEGLIRKVLADPPLPRTASTITTAAALESELALVRSRGFAIDDEENEVGICCVGAPIIDYAAQAIGAISISGPRERMDRERCVQLGPRVRDAAHQISRRRGYFEP
jgi:IclR family acetate operon transcriptional repressor